MTHTHYLDAAGRLRPVGAGAPAPTGPPTPPPRHAALAAVASCPHRGPVLPLSQQPYATAGCRCGELTECRAGKGARPGKVTTEDCVSCRHQALSESADATLPPGR